MPERKEFYITTSIIYTNARPHIGFAFELVQADVIARHQRLLGKNVRFLTGADEHGTKNARAAEKENKSPQKFVDEIVESVQELEKALKISNDDFIRTSDKTRHWPSAQKLWQKLLVSNDIYKKSYQGLYCVGHESFIKESELEDGLCPDHKVKPELIEEENYFFRLSKYTDKLRELIESKQLEIIPDSRRNEILALIREGLEDVSFSRPSEKLKWGIPVPGDETQTIYVWADALANYLSGVGYGSNKPEFKKFWPPDVQVIGKDILRFHAAIWPAMLLSADLPLPKRLFVHGHILSEGQKMSKSLGNVVDPLEIIEKYGADALRYYFLREISPVQDGDFAIAKFEARYQADLANDLGNLVNRVLTLALKHENLIVKDDIAKTVEKHIEPIWKKYHELLSEFRFNEALDQVWSLVRYANEYIDKKKLWELPEINPQEFGRVIGELLLYIVNIAALLEPFLPQTSERIFKQIGVKRDSEKSWIEQLSPKKGKVLFPRI